MRRRVARGGGVSRVRRYVRVANGEAGLRVGID